MGVLGSTPARKVPAASEEMRGRVGSYSDAMGRDRLRDRSGVARAFRDAKKKVAEQDRVSRKAWRAISERP
jgi:hypothetical protein